MGMGEIRAKIMAGIAAIMFMVVNVRNLSLPILMNVCEMVLISPLNSSSEINSKFIGNPFVLMIFLV